MLDEPMPAHPGSDSHPHTRAWSSKIEGLFDGYVFVTPPEYNPRPGAALKNANRFPSRRNGQQGRRRHRYGASLAPGPSTPRLVRALTPGGNRDRHRSGSRCSLDFETSRVQKTAPHNSSKSVEFSLK